MSPALDLILAILIRSAAVLAAAWLLALLLRRRSAAARHAVWAAAMAAVLALPIIAALAPRLSVLPEWAGDPVAVLPPLDLRALQPAPSADAAAPGAAPTSNSAGGLPAALSPASAAVALWLIGAAVLLARPILGRLALRRVERTASVAADERWQRLLQQTQRELVITRPVRLLLSAGGGTGAGAGGGPGGVMPMTWGILRPRVLLPIGAQDWSDARRRTVLRHELAHVRRRDCLTDLLAQIARALYWPSPLAWLALAQMRTERERACDDLVLSLGERQSTYAQELVAVAAGLRAGRVGALGAAAMAMARPSHLDGRIRDILEDRRDRRMISVRQALSVGVVLGAVAIFAACASGRSAPPAKPTPAAPAPDEAWKQEPMYQSAIRMRNIIMAAHAYAAAHNGALPPDLGSLLAHIPEKDDAGRARTPQERAATFLAPRDDGRIEVPAEPTPQWVNLNTSYRYLGNAEVKLNAIPDWSTVAIMVEKSQAGYPSKAPGFEGVPVFPIAFVDSHVSIEQRGEVDRAVAASSELWQAARGVEPQPHAAPPIDPALRGSMIRMRNLLMAVQIYAQEHDDALPPDLWSLVPYLPGVDDQGRPLEGGQRLKGLLSPRDDSRVDLPAEATEAWVKEHASYVYLGRAGARLGDIDAGSWATTVLLHEKDLPPYAPVDKNAPVKVESVPLGFIDGHVEAVPKDAAAAKLAESRKRIDEAAKK